MQKTILYNVLIPKVFTKRPDFEKTAIFDLFGMDSRGRRKDPLFPGLILRECARSTVNLVTARGLKEEDEK